MYKGTQEQSKRACTAQWEEFRNKGVYNLCQELYCPALLGCSASLLFLSLIPHAVTTFSGQPIPTPTTKQLATSCPPASPFVPESRPGHTCCTKRLPLQDPKASFSPLAQPLVPSPWQLFQIVSIFLRPTIVSHPLDSCLDDSHLLHPCQ